VTAPTVVRPSVSTPVVVGVNYSANLDAAFTAFGANRADIDIRKGIERIVADINATGGLGGRRLQAVIHGTDPLVGSFDQQGQEACTTFTEDHKAVAVVGGALNASQSLLDCLSRRGVAFLWEYQILIEQSTFDRHAAHLFQPSGVAAERLAAYIDDLVTGRWLTESAVIGVLRYDEPHHARFVRQIIEPRLRAAGFRIREDIGIQRPPSTASAGDTAAQANSAVLRFRSAQVTHVILVPTGGVLPFIFMPLADSQGYVPVYALNSLDIPNFVAPNVPARQLRGSRGLGWLPPSDLSTDRIPRNLPTLERCAKVTGARDDDVVRFCDGLYLLKAAFDRGAPATAGGIRSALEAVGTSYVSPWATMGTRFAPGRHDGAAAARTLAFDEGCRCFSYTGPLRSLG
jgi:ABC-type branched-subunit amino acid transport system substrate-binding protein